MTTTPPANGTNSLQTVTSTDSTTIAYEKTGSGPTVILISTVAEDHTALSEIAAALSDHFAVINFDRRGRGGSGDPQPYDPAREIDDIAALIEIGGGSAALASGSAGCVLALDAASVLGDAVTALYLYEPPFIVSDAQDPMPADYLARQREFIAAGKRSEAVEYFMSLMGIPPEWLEGMKADPSWDQMVSLAHTYVYDGQIVEGLQAGKPLPHDRWSITAPVMVGVGENSEPFVHEGASALAEVLPDVTIDTLAGQDHSSFWMAPDAVAESARAFLAR